MSTSLDVKALCIYIISLVHLYMLTEFTYKLYQNWIVKGRRLNDDINKNEDAKPDLLLILRRGFGTSSPVNSVYHRFENERDS